MYITVYSLNRKLLVSSHEKVLGIFWATLQVMQDGDTVQVGRNEDILGGAYFLNLVVAHQQTLNAIDAAQISARGIVPQTGNSKSRFCNTMDSESDKPYQMRMERTE